MDKKKISLVIMFVVLIAGILTIFLLPKSAKAPTKTPILIPTQIPVDSKAIENAKQILSQAISRTLNSTLINQSTYSSLKSLNISNAFESRWQTLSSTISAHFQISSDQTDISSLIITILTTDMTIPSEEIIQGEISKFLLILPENTWECKNISNLVSCANFWKENNLKRGIKLEGPIELSSGQTVSAITYCEIYKESVLYNGDACTN